MAHLLQDLVFIDNDANGKEFHRTFPAGTPITEARDGGDARWKEEMSICEDRVSAYAKKGDKGFYVMFLGGRPRLIHRRYWDPTFFTEETRKNKRTFATGESDCEGRSPVSTPDGDADQLAGRDFVDSMVDLLTHDNASPLTRVDSRATIVKTDSTAGNASSQGTRPGLHSPSSSGSSSDEDLADDVDRTPSFGNDRPVAQYGLVVIVDLLNLLVRAFHAGPPSKINGVRSLLQTCANVIERLSPEYLLFAADGGHADRSRLLPSYKAHRPPKPLELVHQIELAEKAIEAIGWPLIRVRDWEADDVIASLAETIQPTSAGVVVCSCDKDLLQLCEEGRRVKIYHPWDGGKYLGGSHIEEKYGIKRNQFVDYLAVAGDTSDGVPGVKGIGPKKAAELLGRYDDLENILESARVLKITGAAGKYLREQADGARVSKQLVTLHRGLRIPFTWHDCPATSPAAGWVDALRRMDLGAAAQRLSEVLPVTGRVRSGSSRIEVSHDQPVWNAAQSESSAIQSDRGVEAAIHKARRPSDQISGPEDHLRPVSVRDGENDSEFMARLPAGLEQLGVPAAASLFAGGAAGAAQPAARRIFPDVVPWAERAAAALAEARGRRFDEPDWFVNFPVIAELPPCCDREILCRSVYATERTRKEPAAENGFKPGTDFHYVADLAMRGLDYASPQSGVTATNPTPIQKPAKAVQPKPANCLF